MAYLTEEKGMKRPKAVLLLTGFTWAVGMLCSLSFGPLNGFHILGNTLFDFLDKLCSNWLMTAGGLLFLLFTGWKMRREEVWDEFTGGGKLRGSVKAFPVVWFLLRFVAPAGMIIVFLTNLLL